MTPRQEPRRTPRRTQGGPAPRAGAVRAARAVLCAASLAALLAGCGIRPTEVPTDFGAAPSRVPCTLSDPDSTAEAGKGVPAQVFLLCGSSLVTVDRRVSVPDGTPDARRRLLVAQGLLDYLARTPSAAERQAGFTTDVRGGMTVGGPRPGDPDDTLRLSVPPADLGSYALAQIVCTFSDSAAADGDGSVILGGPADTSLNRYECTDDVRSKPGSSAPPSTRVTGG